MKSLANPYYLSFLWETTICGNGIWMPALVKTVTAISFIALCVENLSSSLHLARNISWIPLSSSSLTPKYLGSPMMDGIAALNCLRSSSSTTSPGSSDKTDNNQTRVFRISGHPNFTLFYIPTIIIIDCFGILYTYSSIFP